MQAVEAAAEMEAAAKARQGKRTGTACGCDAQREVRRIGCRSCAGVFPLAG